MYRPPNFTDEQWLAFKEAAAQPDRTWALEIAMDLDDGTHLDLYEFSHIQGAVNLHRRHYGGFHVCQFP